MLPFATEPDRFMGARFRQSTSIAGWEARPTSSAALEVSWQKSSLEMPRCESSLSRVCEAGGRGSVRDCAMVGYKMVCVTALRNVQRDGGV